MRRLAILGAALAAASLAACGSSSSSTTTPPPSGFQQPAGTVAVNFTVDDTANKVFTAGTLEWKGSFVYDTTTRKITYDATWGGGYPPLYDDGPWTAGGHEPATAVAGDHKWGVTVFVTPPVTGTQAYAYGLQDKTYQDLYGNGWIWIGTNGGFDVAAGATAPITAAGMTLPAFGTTDMQLIINKNALAAGTWDTSFIRVKGSPWAWSNVLLADNGTKGDATAGDGMYTFQLSAYTGAGNPFSHSGLLHSGDKPEFIFVLGGDATNPGVEYKDPGGVALSTGITAAIKPSGSSTWTPVTIGVQTNNNTYFTVP